MAGAESGDITVEVVYARAEVQTVIALRLTEGATAARAIEMSGILRRCPKIDLRISAIGVYGKPVTLDHRLRDHDRLEIYRPLLADPKESRRRRAAQSDRPGSRNARR
jgi:uncharacterized protein